MSFIKFSIISFFILPIFNTPAQAAVLADDRADIMTHFYSGGGVTAQGPALLVRKGNDQSFSAFATYYVDNVTSASIDVEATASEYSEKRDEIGLGIDYLYNDTIATISYNSSEESDYVSDSINIDMSQEFFSGLTTFNMGYSTASDTVGKRDTDLSEPLDRYRYRLGLSQVISKNWITSVNYESIAEKGYLQSPYRSAILQGAYVPEQMPSTRTSEALAFRSLTYFDWRGSIRFDYRLYSDSWGIESDTFEFGVSKYLGGKNIVDFSIRLYSQSKASFYYDNAPADFIYISRDKELSTFSNTTFKASYTYHMFEHDQGFFSKGTFTTSFAIIQLEYDDFTNYETGENYSFDATVAQLLLSLWF